jgi:N-acetylmuramic acid 6-phosphate etherase
MVDEATRGLDLLETDALVARLIERQRKAFDAVSAVAPALSIAVERIVTALRAGRTLHYVGAGTSGRLAMLDAAECPPTFGTSPDQVRAHIAGGNAALTRAVEGAEDDASAGEAEAGRAVRAGDVVIGLSASGGAPYVTAWLRAAREAAAYTIALSGSEDSALSRVAEQAIVLETGPEPLTGSTRLVAGTAQKLALNTLSTAAMVRLGKVYDNLMVDVVATNAKLHARAVRLVRALSPTEDDETARELLERAGGSVKRAIVMARLKVDAEVAASLLERETGLLRPLIDQNR